MWAVAFLAAAAFTETGERFGEDRVTGGDEMTELLGIEIERDWTKKTIRLHQTAFVEKLLESFNGERLKSTRGSRISKLITAV